MKTLSNSAATQEAKDFSQTWVGDCYGTQWAKEKVAQIRANGGRAYYKATGDKYTVYSY